MSDTTKSSNLISRPPVVAIMGHVDHGKSSLLDYIRETNIVATEAGGITQHVSAYEVEYTPSGSTEVRRITFIDTPGHAAFSGMRQRGATIADIAILIVSAEESVKEQTKEALRIIQDNAVPYLVAITKIDKSNANVEKVKQDLATIGVYLEGYGGTVSCVAISSKTGQGIHELLDTILLLAELEDFTGNPGLMASGYIVESHIDQQRGNSATLIIKNGSLKKGQFVVAGCGIASTRILENFMGKSIEEATFSSPIHIAGFSVACPAGSSFTTYETKKEAEEVFSHQKPEDYVTLVPTDLATETVIVPVIIKSDVAGMIEAVTGEIEKQSHGGVFFKIIKAGVGDINESDIQTALTDPKTLIIGFNVEEDKRIANMNGYETITRATFSIIYKMSEWLSEMREKMRYKTPTENTIGSLTVLKVFSLNKKGHVIGGRVTEGMLSIGTKVQILRAGEIIGTGTITELQAGKSPAQKVLVDTECGMKLETTIDIEEKDILIHTTTTYV